MSIKHIPVFFLFFIASFDMRGQCNADKLSSNCIPMLGKDFKLLKSYIVDNQNGTKNVVEYSYIFAKGTQYMINLCTGEENNGIVVSLLDGKRNKVASNKINDKFLSAVVYPCAITGIYYIHFTFEGSQGCAGSALGFKPGEQYAIAK